MMVVYCRITCVAVNHRSHILVCGDEAGMIQLRSLGDLTLVGQVGHADHGGITSLGFSTGTTTFLFSSLLAYM